MIRILQCVNNMHRAGLETVLMNYYRNIDRTRVQFDFLVHRQEESDYDREILAMGGRIYRAPRLYPQNYPAYFAFMKAFFRDHPEYRIVHSHIDAMSYLPLLAAKQAGIPVRIAHSHSTSIDMDLKYPLKQFFRFRLGSAATHFFSCGQKAGNFLFRGQPYHFVPNAVDADQFRYSESLRQAKRRELGLTNELVIGHAGRLTGVKNHEFLLRVFARLLQRRPDAVLLLAGAGEKEADLRSLSHELGLDDSVRFLGSRGDMAALYQAMDVFVMPSLFEGVPVVGIEAQLAGLPCIFSDRVPDEVCFTDLCRFLSLELAEDVWVDEILSAPRPLRCTPESGFRKYNAKDAAVELAQCYETLWKGESL